MFIHKGKCVFIFCFTLLFSLVTLHGQEESEESANNESTENKNNKIPFGQRFTHTLEFTDKKNHILDINLKLLPKKYAKEYYNENVIKGIENPFEDANHRIAFWESKDQKTINLDVLPLEANTFYFLDIEYTETFNNIYYAFYLMYKEGFDMESVLSHPTEWMKVIEKIDEANGDYKLYYIPTKQEIISYKNRIKSISLKGIKGKTLEKLKDITHESFPILNFNTPSDEQIIKYAKWVKGKKTFDKLEDLDMFLNDGYFGFYIDYINIYRFYEEHLKFEFENNKFTEKDLKRIIPIVDQKIENKKKSYKGDVIIPNYLSTFSIDIDIFKGTISTNTESFETSYKRYLTPDFGYVGYALGSIDNIRGAPFVGVNISLAPVNKDVPMSLSKLSVWQRLSIHTGVTLNSLAEANRRDDFFDDLSLMFGAGYKVGTQATRINLGGIIYRKIDPINAGKSLAIAPYIGLSIDIEIRNWLTALIPSFGNNFKK